MTSERSSTRKRATNETFFVGKFLVVSRCSRAKKNAKKCTKKVCCTCKVAFLLIRPTVVSSPLSSTRFYILFEQRIHIIESFAFSPG